MTHSRGMTPGHREVFVYYQTINRDLNRRLIHEGRCDERLKNMVFPSRVHLPSLYARMFDVSRLTSLFEKIGTSSKKCENFCESVEIEI
jgi:hypothetical protein